MVNAWKVIFPTLVIFIAGVITGGLLVKYTRDEHFRPRTAATVNAGGGAIANNPWLLKNQQLLKRMDRELDLTPEQHTHIDAILKDSQERIKTIFHPIAPQMNHEIQQVRAQIARELTPEQRKKLEGITRPHAGGGKMHGGTNAPSNYLGTNAVGSNVVATNANP